MAGSLEKARGEQTMAYARQIVFIQSMTTLVIHHLCGNSTLRQVIIGTTSRAARIILAMPSFLTAYLFASRSGVVFHDSHLRIAMHDRVTSARRIRHARASWGVLLSIVVGLWGCCSTQTAGTKVTDGSIVVSQPEIFENADLQSQINVVKGQLASISAL